MIDFNVIYLLSVAVTSWGTDPKSLIEFLRMTFNFVYFFAYNDTSTDAFPIFPTSCCCFVSDIRVSKQASEKQALMSIRVTGWFDVPEDVLSRPRLRCRTFKTWNLNLVGRDWFEFGVFKAWTFLGWFNERFSRNILICNEFILKSFEYTIDSDLENFFLHEWSYLGFRILFEFKKLPSKAINILIAGWTFQSNFSQ